MNWDVLLSAGATAAVVSGSVSILTTFASLKYQKRKDKYQYYGPIFHNVYSQLLELKQKYGGSNFNMMVISEKIKQGKGGRHGDALFDEALVELQKGLPQHSALYSSCRELYEKYKIFFPSAVQDELDTLIDNTTQSTLFLSITNDIDSEQTAKVDHIVKMMNSSTVFIDLFEKRLLEKMKQLNL